MEMNEQLIRSITAAVVEQILKNNGGQLPENMQTGNTVTPTENPLKGKTRMRPKHS